MQATTTSNMVWR